MTFTTIQNTVLPDAFVGVAYEAAFSAVGATAAALTISAGTTQTNKQALPAGLSYTTTGRITGTPTAAGIYNLSVKVADGTNTSDNNALTLVVHSAPVADGGGYPSVTGDLGMTSAAAQTRTWPTVQ